MNQLSPPTPTEYCDVPATQACRPVVHVGMELNSAQDFPSSTVVSVFIATTASGEGELKWTFCIPLATSLRLICVNQEALEPVSQERFAKSSAHLLEDERDAR